MRLRTGVLLVTAAVVLTAVAGCGSSGGTDPAQLEGSWVVESFGAPGGLEKADPSVTSDLTLRDGTATGNGGVNSFGGTYKASAGKLSFADITSTLIAGPPAADAQEQRFFEALRATKGFEMNEGKLVLTNRDNDTLVVLAPK